MMNSLLEPYLFFGGRCDEALAFYQAALGAEVEMRMRYQESPEPPPPGMLPPDWGSKVMHASLRIGTCRVMVSDGCEAGTPFAGFSLSLALPEVTEVDRVFHALAEGGRVTMPLSTTFWSPRFGMLVDRFGIGWMVSLRTQGV